MEKRNVGLGLFLAILAGLIGAIVWAAISYFTGYTFSIISLIIGTVIGSTLSKHLKVSHWWIGLVGGGLALFFNILGTFISALAIIGSAYGLTISELYTEINHLEVLKYCFSFEVLDPKTLAFYGLAVFVGFKQSIYKKVEKHEDEEETTYSSAEDFKFE